MKKTARLEIRLTAAEKKEISEKSERLGLSISDYARQILLHGKAITLSDEEKRNITAIGRNFNQLVRLSNARNIISVSATEELNRIIEELKKHYY